MSPHQVTLEGRLIGQKQTRSIFDDCVWRQAEVRPDADVGRGVQCFDAGFLGVYTRLPDSPLQLAEDLEQLKVLENGYKIKVSAAHPQGAGSSRGNSESTLGAPQKECPSGRQETKMDLPRALKPFA
jgi:hypothetical protein